MKNLLIFFFLALAAIAQAQPQPSTQLVFYPETQSWYEITTTPRLLGDSATYQNYLQVQYDQIAAELSALVSAVEAKKFELRRAQRAIEDAANQIGVDVVGEIDASRWTGTWEGTVRQVEASVRMRVNNKGQLQMLDLARTSVNMLLKDNTTAILIDYPADGVATVLYRKGRTIVSEDGTIALEKGADR